MKQFIYVLVGMLIISSVMAQNNQRQGRSGRGGGRQCQDMVYKQLNLTDEQIDKLQEFKKDQMQQRHKLRQKKQSLKFLLKTEMMEDKPDGKEIRSLAKKIGKMEEEQILNKWNNQEKLRKVLNDKQFKKLSLEMMMKRSGGEKGKRKGGRRQGDSKNGKRRRN